MKLIEKIRKPIEEEMRMLQKTFADALYSDNPLLESVNDYVLQKSGKQLRPMMVILAAKLCGEVNQSTINSALSLELLHTASLIHDDVVDNTLERRGRPSVNARWTNKIAILSGDYILSKSIGCAVQTSNIEILKSIANIGKQLSDGELLQLNNLKITDSSEENYYTIIRKKTALLFSTCTEVGGLSVNANERQLEMLRNFGEYLGLAFQIKDDIFDYMTGIDIGKPTGNDIRDGKVTLPIIYAVKQAKSAECEKIIQLIENKNFNETNVDTIIHFAHKSGGVDYAISRMNAFKDKAVETLDYFPDNELKKSLISCAEYAVERAY